MRSLQTIRPAPVREGFISPDRKQRHGTTHFEKATVGPSENLSDSSRKNGYWVDWNKVPREELHKASSLNFMRGENELFEELLEKTRRGKAYLWIRRKLKTSTGSVSASS